MAFMRFVTNSTSLNFKCRLVEQIIKINPGLSDRMVAMQKSMKYSCITPTLEPGIWLLAFDN